MRDGVNIVKGFKHFELAQIYLAQGGDSLLLQNKVFPPPRREHIFHAVNFPLTFQCTSIIEWDTFLKDLAFSSTVQRTAEGYRHLELDAILDAIEAV